MVTKIEISDELRARCQKVRMLVTDCDGVLTDGRLYFSANGEELKVFDVKDGQGLALWHKAGHQSAIISGRGSEAIVRARAKELGVRYVVAGSRDKAADLTDILSKEGLQPSEAAFVGDDVGDLPAMELAGLSVAVSDAVGQVKAAAKYVTNSKGGRGAIREVVELLLSAKTDR